LLANACVKPPRQIANELRLSDLDGCIDLSLGRFGAAKREVLSDRHREQRRVLERGGHDLAGVRVERHHHGRAPEHEDERYGIAAKRDRGDDRYGGERNGPRSRERVL
jgi:hypothetical protein